jgi:2-succinyl-5-enolpyruvyl-6-hydroxy-3-cyclohexene-1-carboxylate synthase
MSAGPLGRGIGWRDELRHNVAGGAPLRIVQGRQILLHCAAGPRRIAILAPILTCDRALLIGIGRNQAPINGKAFATNQTGRDARLDDPLEHPTKNISLAEALVAGARKCRMIGDSVLNTELAEPAIGEVHLNFTTDQPLRTDRKDISHDQHPDHQFRIDRRTTHRRIMRC